MGTANSRKRPVAKRIEICYRRGHVGPAERCGHQLRLRSDTRRFTCGRSRFSLFLFETAEADEIYWGAAESGGRKPALSGLRQGAHLLSLPGRMAKAWGRFAWRECPISTAQRFMTLSDLPTARRKAIPRPAGPHRQDRSWKLERQSERCKLCVRLPYGVTFPTEKRLDEHQRKEGDHRFSQAADGGFGRRRASRN